MMKGEYVIGVPQEMKQGECRVGLIPDAVKKIIEYFKESGIKKVRVLVECVAGQASGYDDDYYMEAGANLVYWKSEHLDLRMADLIVKVKEPLPPEYNLLLSGKKKTVAGFFHLHGNPKLAEFFSKNNISYFDYGDVVDQYGFRPILAAMSKIAGRAAVLEGFHYLRKPGRGIMPEDAVVTIVGAGVAGMAAVETASHLHVREIFIFDKNMKASESSSRFVIQMATTEKISEILPKTDLLISGVASRGRAAPKIITRKMIKSMPEGAVFVDIAIDEGGSSETSRPTTHSKPVYVEEGVLHYCVPNIPGAYPVSASQSLSKAALPHLIRLIESHLGINKK